MIRNIKHPSNDNYFAEEDLFTIELTAEKFKKFVDGNDAPDTFTDLKKANSSRGYFTCKDYPNEKIGVNIFSKIEHKGTYTLYFSAGLWSKNKFRIYLNNGVDSYVMLDLQ